MSALAPLHDTDPVSLGGYRLSGRLGEGGQGTVYLGRAPDGTEAAIKTLNGAGMDDPETRRRFVREADAARQVASFCTAAVLAADFEAEPPFIVSEFVAGLSLKQQVEAHGVLAGGDLSRLAVATATALVAIHEAGIVHRDLKPANVLLGQGGARVIDFGIAQDTRGAGTLTNSTIGTPAFMAPEQISGDPVSPATDVFAWGAVLVFAATGGSPFQGATVPMILHQVLSAEPDVSGVPEPLRGLVAAALAKDPAARPSSVDVLMALLGRKERPAGHEGVTAVLRDARATVTGPGEPGGPTLPWAGATTVVAPPARRATPGRWVLGAGAAVLVLALVVGAVLLGRYLGAEDGAPAADGPSSADGGSAGADGEVSTPPDIPRFTEEQAGSWEGVDDNGELVELSTTAGERIGRLAYPESEYAQYCDAPVKLTGPIDRGYHAAVSLSELCLGGMLSAKSSEVYFDGAAVTIDLYDTKRPEGDPVQQLRLKRSDG
ncbi:serine/threonine protein kinase [Murinocardiopsis flavida]|uniref:Serine/threonine protein kinase n=1 Tax=Murinocardiopsis flavida TaxID=645275 RepID=A0A2P8DIM2_9ACTN|nr:serine/threonine-protein kinase [Murinocardiopsis flavida]PSK97076.1 serine/threonine protein kinase [Murinocardiopsis flavida]